MELSSQSLANITWAFAKLLRRDPSMMELLASAAMSSTDLDLQSVASIAWAFATLDVRSDTLSDFMAARSIEQITKKNATPVSLANLSSAFATWVVCNLPLMRAIS